MTNMGGDEGAERALDDDDDDDDDDNDENSWKASPSNPVNWSEHRKWRITAVACFVTFIVGLNNTSPATIAPAIAEQFAISDDRFQYTFLAVTAWSVAAAVFPMLVLPLMERWGVRWIYLLSYTLFTLSLLPQALARSFHTLVITRLFAGAFGGVLQNAVDGIAANLWEDSRDRAAGVSLYIFALVFGVTCGSVEGAIGGTRLGWRWTFWIELIIYGAFFPVVYLAIQECRGPVIQRRKKMKKLEEKTQQQQQQQQPRNESSTTATTTPDQTQTQTQTLLSSLGETRTVMLRSFRLLATEPPIIFFTLWSAFSFGTVFLSTQGIALVFGATYRFSAYQSGLAQASLAVGEVLAALAQVPQNRVFARGFPGWSARTRARAGSGGGGKGDERNGEKKEEEAEETPQPEAHLYLSIPSSFLCLSGGLFLYAWTSRPNPPTPPHFLLPCLGLALLGFGITTVVTAASLYVTDGYASHAASAIAAVAFAENLLAALLPLAALPMYRALGGAWAASVLGFVGLALSCGAVVLACVGRRVRRRSRWAAGEMGGG